MNAQCWGQLEPCLGWDEVRAAPSPALPIGLDSAPVLHNPAPCGPHSAAHQFCGWMLGSLCLQMHSSVSWAPRHMGEVGNCIRSHLHLCVHTATCSEMPAFISCAYFWSCLVNLSAERLQVAKSLISIFFPDGQDATETAGK